MLARTRSYTTVGLQAVPVDVEVDAARGLPGFTLVGLPGRAVKEAKERVRSAILNSQFHLPSQRFVVNLAPADLKKEGGVYDLAIALGILAASRQLDPARLAPVAALGELALDGRLRPVHGTLPIALALPDRRPLLVPLPNAPEAALVSGARIIPVASLRDAAEYLAGTLPALPTPPPQEHAEPLNQYDVDFADVKGQTHVKRALEIAVAGGHHALLIGPPGAGKTMLAERVPTIQPPLTFPEALETTAVHSVAGLLLPPADDGRPLHSPLLRRRPFRAPHHTSSAEALIGGGVGPRPGEISLAQHGVLFLDELPEFRRDALEALRQPLEEGRVRLGRARGAVEFPARCALLAAMNPCYCGWLTDSRHRCRCSSTQVQRYLAKVSGPLLDRIDLHIDVPAVPFDALTRAPEGESSSQIRARVQRAIAFRRKRSQQQPNAQLRTKELKTYCQMTSDVISLLKSAMQELNL